MSNRGRSSGIWRALRSGFNDFVDKDLFAPRTSDDIVSSNAKVVLYSLFALVGSAVILYAVTVYLHQQPQTGDSPQTQLDELQQIQQINSVFIAAISGGLALGGTLIAQIWGRTKKTGV